MTKSKLASTALAAAVAALFSQGAVAQEVVPFQFTKDTNLIGLGIFSTAEWYGADKRTGAGVPLLQYTLGEGRYVQWVGPEIRANVVPRTDVRAGPLLRFRPRRDDDAEDETISRMRPVATANELGGFVAYHMPLDANPLHKVVFYGDVTWNTTNVYDGATGNIRATYYHPFEGGMGGKPLLGTIGLGLFMTSDHFANRYFGINGSDVGLFPERAGVPYNAEGGLTSIKIPFALVSQVDPKWIVIFGGNYEKLLNDAKDSPVVQKHGDDNQWSVGIAATYLF
jgi:outer membrane scaffolding protein for murein synthesis (MipA/OmpV family)